MIDLIYRATTFMSSRRLLILWLCIFIVRSRLPWDATLSHSTVSRRNTGMKSLDVILAVIV